ncbi:MAG TPA: phosphatase PAP2 family protein [Gemmatimonadales bacterium]|nr:phosphatase PAP2 family protein [Gemmatimonadales bacterium]
MALKRLRPIDWLMSGYGLVVAATALVRLPGYPPLAWIAAAHLLIPAVALLCTSERVGRTGRILRDVYPIVLLVGLYGALDVLAGGGAVAARDATVQGWEEALFGVQVSRLWWQAQPSAFWSALLHASYFAYYVIVPAPAIWFAWKGRTDDLRWYVFAVMATFVSCYLWFIFFPVAGPYYEFPRPAAWFTDNGPARLVYATLARGSSYGAAFPSSHVAATVTAAAAAWRANRILGVGLAVPTLLLTVAVVYCQMHYAVDALAGVAMAGGCLALTARVMRP